MNQILAGIYGTAGSEKVASEGNSQVSTLSDLAMIIASDNENDLQKVASSHEAVLQDLLFFDVAGRTAAQSEFSEMEKAAADGDWSALEAFFSEE